MNVSHQHGVNRSEHDEFEPFAVLRDLPRAPKVQGRRFDAAPNPGHGSAKSGAKKERFMAGSHKLILLVDDDVALCKLVGHWLTRAGYVVEVAHTGPEALEALSVTIPDVVLLDVNLPGLNGIETLRRVRQTHPHLPVVIFSADSNVEQVVAAMHLGAYDYLVKPIDRPRLVSTLQHAQDRQELKVRLAQLEREATGSGYPNIVGNSPAMQDLFRQLDRLTACDITTLVHGESGTGKELIAQAIHDGSGRREGPFVALNCAAVPETLQESELFGHEKGAFTGATSRRKGRFELADGGTLFLDEVGELTPSLQAKLLRVLQERSFTRLGGNEHITSDFRLLAASHKRLKSLVDQGKFREDLYFRIAVFELDIPPLRHRGGDVEQLAHFFLEKYSSAFGHGAMDFEPAAVGALASYEWPGNVRELENAVQRCLVTAANGAVTLQDLPASIRASYVSNGATPAPVVDAKQPVNSPSDGLMEAASPETVVGAIPSNSILVTGEEGSFPTLEQAEATLVAAALERADQNLSEACRMLGISRTTLYRKLDRYGLRGEG